MTWAFYILCIPARVCFFPKMMCFWLAVTSCPRDERGESRERLSLPYASFGSKGWGDQLCGGAAGPTMRRFFFGGVANDRISVNDLVVLMWFEIENIMKQNACIYIYTYMYIYWVVPPPSNSGNEGLGWDPLLKIQQNPGGDSYWEGGQPNRPENS